MPVVIVKLSNTASQRAAEKARGSSYQRGYTRDWNKYSHWLIQQVQCSACGRNHALCERCQRAGKDEPSVLTDHIIPVQSRQDPNFWTHSNHQGLCTRCHAIKTTEEKRNGLTR